MKASTIFLIVVFAANAIAGGILLTRVQHLFAGNMPPELPALLFVMGVLGAVIDMVGNRIFAYLRGDSDDDQDEPKPNIIHLEPPADHDDRFR